MEIPEYVSVAEVQRVCKELKIRDWTALEDSQVPLDEARVILENLPSIDRPVRLEDFAAGLEVELEHGRVFPQINVTNNHPLLTGRIVLAHFMEMLDYYQRLAVAELEGDLFKAVATKKLEKMEKNYRRLAAARQALSAREAEQLG